MNILHLRSSEFFGGPEKAILGQCRAMRTCDFTCASFIRKGQPNQFLEQCRSRSIRTIALPQRSVFDMSPTRLLRQAVLEQRIRILVSHDYKSNLFGALALRGLDTVQVAHFRGRTTEDIKARVYNFLDQFVLRWMDHVFVVCQAARNQLVEQGIRSQMISVVPNGYDSTMPLHPPSDFAPTESGAPVQMISAGRLSKEKGFDILVEAARLLDRDGFDFHISVYGSGPEEGRLRNQISRAKMTRRISLLGFSDDLAARMRQAKLLVIPSRSEGMPNVILEAWAAGLAVVATPVGGVPEMIDHGVNGILCDDSTPESLSAALSEALRTPARLPSLGRQGQDKLQTHFSFEKQADLLGTLYDRLDRPAHAGTEVEGA